MNSNPRPDSDPFADSGSSTDQQLVGDGSTLNVGRNATLTLGAESLIVLDEGFVEESKFNCFGILPKKSRKTRAIPYFNVIWASVAKTDITVRYAKPSSKNDARVTYINYELDNSTSELLNFANAWTENLLDRAYNTAQRKKRIKVLINPFGGAGNAEKLFKRDIEPVFAAARCELDVEVTRHQGHATEIARDIDLNTFDVIACCSGDGTPYEVFNGLGKRSNAMEALSRMAVVNIPCGSGNAMSHNLNGTGSPSLAALSVVKGLRMPMDLASVTQGDRRYLSFLSQSVGIVAESDLGTDNIRWMGPHRFIYGFLVRLLGKTTYPCDIAVKVEIEDKPSIYAHYQSIASSKSEAMTEEDRPRINDSGSQELLPLQHGTPSTPLTTSSGWSPLTPYPTLGNLYCGNMSFMAPDAMFFPCSLPSDGLLDLVMIDGNISRLLALKSLLSVEDGTFFDQEYVGYRKVSALRVVPKYAKGCIAIDGESIPFEPFQVEVHKGLGTVLSRSGRSYESKGPNRKAKK